jgi:hypothetical protein
MPEFRTAPEALADAARAVTADGRLADEVAGALRASLREVADALPGSRTAREAERLADILPPQARVLAAELTALGAALAVAAGEYVAADETAAGDFRRTGPWSA